MTFSVIASMLKKVNYGGKNLTKQADIELMWYQQLKLYWKL